ncbi:MAG: hypothetical protein ACLFR6_03575 [Salinarchaeum sp.]
MGVHCRTLGHAYESTEFEQDREERAEGTVLVCREYQVCSRCGHREELYHNERLIAPAAVSDSDPLESESQPASDATSPDTPASTEDTGESTADSPSSLAHATSATSSDSEASDASTVDYSPAEPSTESVAGGHRQGDDSHRSSAESSSQLQSSTASPDDGATDADKTTPTVSSPDESEERPTDPEHDDAVILTETAARTTDGGSAVTHPAEDAWRNDQTTAERTDTPPAQLECSGCDATWTRAETPLREGDLCPACHAAYLERQ